MALLMGWVFLNSEAQILLFLTVPVRAKWLLAGYAGVNLLSNFANGDFYNFAALATALLFGYFFSLCTFEVRSPYRVLHRFEDFFLKAKRELWRAKPIRAEYASSKIYDFKTGRAVAEDEDFLRESFAKIKRSGKRSLSLLERIRFYRLTRR
jgi:hypothetical protein